jgi:hypothetical protein
MTAAVPLETAATTKLAVPSVVVTFDGCVANDKSALAVVTAEVAYGPSPTPFMADTRTEYAVFADSLLMVADVFVPTVGPSDQPLSVAALH